MTTKSIPILLLWAVILIVAQAVVFNHICLFHCAIPIVFIYLIIKMPMSIGACWMLTTGFFTGVAVDIFSDTQGMNALACTILAFIRSGIFRLYTPPGDEEAFVRTPSTESMGTASFMKYTFTMVLIYCVLVFSIEAFSMFNPVALLQRIGGSTILSFIIIMAIDTLSKPRARNEKKL